MSSHKVVILGNSGVGKSSFVNAILSTKEDSVPGTTVGCNVSILAHRYHAGSSEEHTELIELWDVGGSAMHQKASVVFLEGATGAILVHDVSNSKSEASLAQWLSLLKGDSLGGLHSLPLLSANVRPLLADVESTPVPTLIVGCKLDLAPARAKQSGYDRINLDCRRELVAGSTNCIILSKFFDSVVERTNAPASATSERRRRLLL